MPKGNPGGNPDLLVATASAKKKEAIEKTEKAIAELTLSDEEITFISIAKKAGVSVSYLYKYEELKNRIKHLREQQKQTLKKKSPPEQQNYQPASDKSKSVLIYNLREENKRLRAEIEGLRRHIEVVQGRNYELVGVSAENTRLKQQLESLTQQLEECHRHASSSPSISDNNPKVATLDKKKSKRQDISENIKSKLYNIGISLNTTLTKTIKSKPEEIILIAIEALEEAVERGQQIENLGGWLNRAIQDGWMPSEKHLPSTKVEREIFNEWFNLAKKQRLVMASSKGDDGQLYVYTPLGVPVPFKQMLADYPIETLKQKS
ncbi:hypothetical protein BLD44_007125 [Mastigocladus laminosus UU774]|nr:hypothetical protein BLD44_007125 [Mastigocladus laminosus UU774]